MKNRSFLENSIFYKAARKTLLSIMGLTLATMRKAEKYSSNFKTMPMVGTVVISAVLANLLLIQIMGKEVAVEWVLYRCFIAVSFLPWLFCKSDLKEIAEGSLFLRLFLKEKCEK